MGLITAVAAGYLALFGLIVGSFINLAADRLPRGESIIRPRSHCRSCGRKLDAVDLIPVLGYFIRMGRCATCGTAIGISSPAVEAISGACASAPVIVLGLWPGAIVGLSLVAAWGFVFTALAARRYASERSG